MGGGERGESVGERREKGVFINIKWEEKMKYGGGGGRVGADTHTHHAVPLLSL